MTHCVGFFFEFSSVNIVPGVTMGIGGPPVSKRTRKLVTTKQTGITRRLMINRVSITTLTKTCGVHYQINKESQG